MTKKIITLAKQLEFKTSEEYMDYCIDTYLNGNFGQCREQFIYLSKDDKKKFITYIYNSQMLTVDKNRVFTFYFNLL